MESAFTLLRRDKCGGKQSATPFPDGVTPSETPLAFESAVAAFFVPQTSQSAVSRVSQPAGGTPHGNARNSDGLPIGKSALRQVGKPAIRGAVCGHARWLLSLIFSLLFFLFLALPLSAQTNGPALQLRPDPEPQRVFAGAARAVTLVWHNDGPQLAEADLRVRLVQTTSASAVRLGETPWKKLQVLPGQTVLETAAVDFPPVKAETKFVLQWLAGTNELLGKTEVLVYPTNLLAELKPLAGDDGPGLYDPQNRLKPLLKLMKLRYTELQNDGLDDFSGKLAIVGPFSSWSQMRDGLADRLKALARNGVAVVWLQPPPEKHDLPVPSFYSVPENTNAVVMVQPELVADLPLNPQSQRNLIYFCRLALSPQTVPLSRLPFQPQP